MALQETAVLDRVVFYDDLPSPSDSIPLLLASPDSEGEVRTGIEVQVQNEAAQIDKILTRTMLFFGAVELAKQLAHIVDAPQGETSPSQLFSGQAAIVG